MNTQELALYERIQQFSFDDIDVRFPFSRKLAKENNWTDEYTQRVIDEYKKFVFLAVVTDHIVTPSEQVDQVWHLHLIYTRSYWEDFCPNILQKPLHHSPTKGGQEEEYKYRNFYNQTLASYEHFFQQQPPSDIWSNSHTRFNRDTQNVRINIQENWIIAKPNLSFFSNFNFQQKFCWIFSLSALMFVGLWEFPAFAAIANSVNNSFPDFLNFSNFLTLYSSLGLIGFSLVYMVGFTVHKITQIPGVIPFLSANLALALFSLSTFSLVRGISSIVGLDFLRFYFLAALAIVLFNFSISRWQLSAYHKLVGKPKLVNPSILRLQKIAIGLGILSNFCLYSLGIARTIIGISRHKPVGYIAAFSLVVGIYFLWHFSCNNQRWNSIIKNTINTIAIFSGIPLLLLGFQGAAWLMYVLIFISFLFFSRKNASSGTKTSSSTSYSSSSNGTCSDGGGGGCGGGGGGGGCSGGCGG
jgi:hypothetical protein